jgi:hypothetical protein
MNNAAVVSHVRTMGRIETSPRFLLIVEQHFNLPRNGNCMQHAMRIGASAMS